MTLEEVETLKKAYAQAARDCVATGMDGLAIHAAHGYLQHEFLWDKTNLRTDAYGGSVENRRRLLVETVQTVRQAVAGAGRPFCIMLRFSQFPPRYDDEKGPPHKGRVHPTPELLRDFVCALRDAGVDLFDASTEEWWHPEFPEAHPTRTFAGWIQHLSLSLIHI